MARKPLTQRAIDALKPSDARVEIPDGAFPGLYFVVQPSGAKSWALRYRHGDRTRKLTLGKYPAVTLAQAREDARRASALVEEGRDPALERQSLRAANLDPQGAFEVLAREFLGRHSAGIRSSTAAEYQRLLEAFAMPAWRGRALRSIGRRDILALLDSVMSAGKSTTANRLLATLRILFGWAVDREIIATAPTANIKMPAVERARQRTLSSGELRLLWTAIEPEPYPFGPLVRLLALTGLRLSEVAESRWREIDLQGQVWNVPEARSKNRVALALPLSSQVNEILEALPRFKDSDYLFTTTKRTPVSGFSNVKKRLDARMLKAIAAQGVAGELPGWTIHDLRRTASSGMAALGYPPHICDAVLNHITGSRSAINRTYDTYRYGPEMRKALQDWADHLTQVVKNHSF